MSVIRLDRCAAAILLLVGIAQSQDAASTLRALTRHADAIVIADVTPAIQAPPGMEAVDVTVIRTLRGTVPSRFTLVEPAGQCCGRTLHGLITSRHLLFLRLEAGAPRLMVSGGRAMVAADAAIERHAAALLAATPEQEVALLADALDFPHPRIRRDAALALPRLPALERLDAAGRGRVAAAATRALVEGPDDVGVELLTASARLRLDEVAAPATRAWLGGSRPELREALLRSLPAFDPETVRATLEHDLPLDQDGQERAVELLARLPPDQARPVLVRLLAGTAPDVAAEAGATLLTHGSVDVAWLRAHLPKAVADDAIARSVPKPPRFRAVLHDGRKRSP